MKIEVIKNENDLMEFKLLGEKYSFPSLLKEKLLLDKSVTFAASKLNHPTDKDSIFIVRTKGKTPKKALTDACIEISKELKDFNTSFVSAIK
ncbi:MAG: RpoL/Rpb11 RNA polymerase subunit family protein [archaeon]